jgi:RNA polymerase sigma factor (sigma-70 family)
VTIAHDEPSVARGRAPTHGIDHRTLFTDAFGECAPRILRYLSRQVSSAEAEDLLGETFCIAWQRRHRYRPDDGPLVGWLFGIAVNLLSRHKRSFLRRFAAHARFAVQSSPDGDCADLVAARVDATSAVAGLGDALAALHQRDRDVLLLSSWGQLDHAEIAIALDIPIGTVRSRLHRARCQLRATHTSLNDLLGDDHV